MPRNANQGVNLPLAIASLCWGFNFVALKIAYLELSVAAMAVGRTAVTWVMMLAICWVRGESLRYPKGEALRILALGFLASGVYMVVFLEGMARTSAAEGAIILSTSPVFVILMSAAIGHEPFRWPTLAGALIALCGVAMVALAGGAEIGGSLLGNGLILLSAGLWAWGVMLARPLVERHSAFRVFTLSLPGAAVALLPFGLAGTLSTPWTGLSWATWLSLLHVGALAGAVSFTAFYVGVRQVGPTGAMLYQNTVPPLAAIFAWLVLGQRLHGLQLAGMGVVVVGVAWAWRSRPIQILPEAVPAEG